MKALSTATALLAISVAFSASAATPPAPEPAPAAAGAPTYKAHLLNKAETDAVLKDPKKVLFIDLRRPDELTKNGGFPVYLSVQFNDLKSSSAWIPKGRPIVTLSNHAGRAGQAADILKAEGFNVIGAVGVQLYEKDGGTLTKISAPTPKATS